MSSALKSEQKEAISTPVHGKDSLAVLPTGFWKSLIFQVLVLVTERNYDRKTSSVVVVCLLQCIVYDQME